MSAIIETIRQELNLVSDPALIETSRRFFKEDEYVRMYGIKTAQVIQLSKTSLKDIEKESKVAVFELCEELWQSGMLEESFIACNWAHSQHKSFEPSDFMVFEHWVYNFISNWASCDTLCNHTIGTFLQMYPEYLEALKKWTKSENRWAKRAAAVSLIIPAKQGLFLDDIFEIATLLLHDPDDIVQKGYGWMLKAASHKHSQEVFNFVNTHKATMPRTALRYAIEKMTFEMKKEAMRK
jgi:3-methyladenine DNA glycosylase AlkD